MTKDIRELNDAELDAVSGGALGLGGVGERLTSLLNGVVGQIQKQMDDAMKNLANGQGQG